MTRRAVASVALMGLAAFGGTADVAGHADDAAQFEALNQSLGEPFVAGRDLPTSGTARDEGPFGMNIDRPGAGETILFAGIAAVDVNVSTGPTGEVTGRLENVLDSGDRPRDGSVTLRRGRIDRDFDGDTVDPGHPHAVSGAPAGRFDSPEAGARS